MIDPEILEKEYQDALKCRVEGKILDIKKSKLNDCNNTLEIYIKGKTSYYKIIGTENSDYAGKKLCLIYTDFPTYNEKNIEYYPKKGDFFQGVAEQSELKSNVLLKYGKKAFNNSTDDFCNGVKIETVNKTGSSTGVISETSSNTGIISENKETKLSNTGVTNITNKGNILYKNDLIIESKNELSQTGVIITKENHLEEPVEIFTSSKNYNELNKCKIHGKIINIDKKNYEDCYFNLIIKLDNNFEFKATEYLENGCITDVTFPIYLENGNEYYPKNGDNIYGIFNVSNNKMLKYGKKAFNNSTDDFCNGVKIETVNKTGSSTGVISETSSNTGIISENKEIKLSNTGVTNITNQENIKENSLNNSVIKNQDIKIEPVIVKNESIINTGVILDNSDEIKENILNKDDLIIESKNELSQTGVITTKENYLEKPVSKIENNSQNYFIFGGIFIVIFIVIVGFFLQKYFKNKEKN